MSSPPSADDQPAEWISRVLDASRVFIAGFHPEQAHIDFSVFFSRTFWARLKQKSSWMQANHDMDDHHGAFSTFLRLASAAERSQFIANQREVLHKLDMKLLALDTVNVVIALNRLTHEFRLTEFYMPTSRPRELVDYIARKPSLFDVNPSLRFIAEFGDLTYRLALEKEQTLNLVDLSGILARRIEADFGISYTPGQIARMAAYLLPDDRHEELTRVFKQRRQVEGKRIAAEPVDPDAVRPANDARVDFAKATVRPRRAKRETGGRAGWGPAKPDLWKP